MYLRGDKIFSSAKAKFCEDVVNIRVALMVTIINKRKKIIMLFFIIMGFIKICPVDKKEVSNSKNKFKDDVNIAIISMLFTLRKYFLKGTSDSYAKNIAYSRSKDIERYVKEKNIIKNIMIDEMIFTLGSSLCIRDLPGKYLPKDMLFTKFFFTSFRI